MVHGMSGRPLPMRRWRSDGRWVCPRWGPTPLAALPCRPLCRAGGGASTCRHWCACGHGRGTGSPCSSPCRQRPCRLRTEPSRGAGRGYGGRRRGCSPVLVSQVDGIARASRPKRRLDCSVLDCSVLEDERIVGSGECRRRLRGHVVGCGPVRRRTACRWHGCSRCGPGCGA